MEFARKLAHDEPVTAEDIRDAVVDALERLAQIIDEQIELLERDEPMGAFDKNEETVTIHSKLWEPHETVTIRVTPTLEDEEWVNNQVARMITPTKGARNRGIAIESNMGATRRLWIERMIVAWTFTKGGAPVPVTRAAIRQLPTPYADFVYNELMKYQPDLDEEEEEDFFGNASAPIVENDRAPLPMKRA